MIKHTFQRFKPEFFFLELFFNIRRILRSCKTYVPFRRFGYFIKNFYCCHTTNIHTKMNYTIACNEFLKINLYFSYFYAMQDKKQQEQLNKLKQLKEKELPENVRKSIAEKEKHVQKPFNK